jgi:hypothetical protein
LLASGRKGILFFSAEGEFVGYILGGNPHVRVAERAPESILNHDIDQLIVTHSDPPPAVRQHVRRFAHVFHASGHDAIGISGLDRLGRHNYGFHPRSADFIDGCRRDVLTDAGSDSGLACRILSQACLQDVSHDYFVDSFRSNLRPVKDFLYDQPAKLDSGYVSQRSPKGPDWGAHGTGDYYFPHNTSFLKGPHV